MGASDCDRAALFAASLPDARPLSRAVTLARLGGVAAPEQLPLGARDKALMALWRQWFGAEVPCLASCPSCGQEVSFDLPLAAFDGLEVAPEGPWRLLTSQDMAAVERLAPAAALAALARAVTGAADSDVAEVSRWLEAHDPLARVEIDLACAFCDAQWARPFDIVAHLWAALRGRGQALMREVHVLAQAYHWSEAEILALPPGRRRLYLQMVMQ